MLTRKCTKCLVFKDENLDNFRLRTGFKDRFNAWCRQCETTHSTSHVKTLYHSDDEYRKKKLNESSAASKKRYAENIDFRKKVRSNNRKNKLLAKYNLTEQQYDEMSDRQSHRCKICGEKENKRRLAVDHSHISGKVRDLLCGPCNRAFGLFKENVYILEKAIAYAKEHQEKEI